MQVSSFKPEILMEMGKAYDGVTSLTDALPVPPEHDAVARYIVALAEHGYKDAVSMLAVTLKYFWQKRMRYKAVVVSYRK